MTTQNGYWWARTNYSFNSDVSCAVHFLILFSVEHFLTQTLSLYSLVHQAKDQTILSLSVLNDQEIHIFCKTLIVLSSFHFIFFLWINFLEIRFSFLPIKVLIMYNSRYERFIRKHTAIAKINKSMLQFLQFSKFYQLYSNLYV